MTKPKSCFVISVIGEEGSEARKYADKLFKYIIEPVAKEAGYTTVERADHDDQPGMITHQIVEKVLNCDLVIADLTEPNPNVYYELAIRHCSGKRYIQMVKQGHKLPFDVAQVRCVQFGLEIDEAEAGKSALLKQIVAAEKDKEPVFNPVTQSQAMVKMERTGDVTQQTLVSILKSQNQMVSVMSDMQRAISDLQRPRVPPMVPANLLRQYLSDAAAAATGSPPTMSIDEIVNSMFAERAAQVVRPGSVPPKDGTGSQSG